MRIASLAVLALSVVAAAQAPAPPGKLVDIGGYRLHLFCTGKGRPTVVLSPGGGDFSLDWSLVQPKVATFARVCSYDRSGEAWSDPGPQPPTMHQEAHDVRAALKAAGESGPFLLVGQSIGGLVVRVFAEMYRADVAGIVLVDATSPDTTLSFNGKLVRMREMAKAQPIPVPQTLRESPPQPPTEEELKQAAAFRKQFGEPKIGPPYDRLPPDIQRLQLWVWSLPLRAHAGDNYFAEELAQLYEQEQNNPHPLGQTPLVTIVGARPERKPDGITQEEWDRLHQEKVGQKRGFATLSTKGKIVEDDKAGHHVHLDDPETVIAAIKEVAGAH